MDESDPEIDYKYIARRGALWTIPVWGAILEAALSAAFSWFDGVMLNWPNICTAFYILFLAGSSLCFLTGFGLTCKPLHFADAAKKGLSSALPVAAAYLLFALAALFSAENTSNAWGTGFGLLSVSGSLIAAVMGAFAKLGYQYLNRTVLSPYKAPPAPPKK